MRSDELIDHTGGNRRRLTQMNSKHADFIRFDLGYRLALRGRNTKYGPITKQLERELAFCRSQYQNAITIGSRPQRLAMIGQITSLRRQIAQHIA
jgi:hypothetical protein